MGKFSGYRSIDNFRNFIVRFKREFRYKGKDEEGMPIYDPEMILPKVVCSGTEKIHGTNAAVGFDVESKEIWFQSRKNVIAPGNDNAGFATWATEKKDIFSGYFDFLSDYCDDVSSRNAVKSIIIFGEWAGGNIQGINSACSKHEKIFIVFDVKLVYKEEFKDEIEEDYAYIKPVMADISDPEEGIYPISEHRGWVKELDFNSPEDFEMEVEKEIMALEDNSIFGELVLGIPGNVGEGFVYRFTYDHKEFIFKCKGDKHSGRQKEKKEKIPMTDERRKKQIAMAKQITPDWRLAQMYKEAFPTDEPTMKFTGEFIKLMMKDIIKEELLVIEEAGLTMKDVNSHIVGYTKKYLTERIREKMAK